MGDTIYPHNHTPKYIRGNINEQSKNIKRNRRRKGDDNMTKLNTLKDFLDTADVLAQFDKTATKITDTFISVTALRQEAIKWIGELNKKDGVIFCLDCFNWVKPKDGCLCSNMKSGYNWVDYEASDLTVIVKWIKVFFNITEDDLK